MYLSVYSPWEFTLAEVDGTQTGMEVEQERGWNVYSRFVDIPPGGEVVLRLGFAGELEPGTPYELTLRPQPLSYPDVVRVDVRDPGGRSYVSSHGARSGVETIGMSTSEEAES
jgi:hypothetical protein